MKFRTSTSALLGLLSAMMLLLGAGSAWAAAEAGRITFAFGNVTVSAADGTERVARRGALVYSGDTIATGNGRVQVRFTDGGFVSLTPDTTFTIDEYRFDGVADGSEKGLFSLVKGGLRALTGLVGKTNRQAYELRTVVATIGIRGTLFRTTFDPDSQRQLVSVGFDPFDPRGGINFTSGGVTVPVIPGGNAVVEGLGVPPRLTTEQADLAAMQPTEVVAEVLEEVDFTEAEALVEEIGGVNLDDAIEDDGEPPALEDLIGDEGSYVDNFTYASSAIDGAGNAALSPDSGAAEQALTFIFFDGDAPTGALSVEVYGEGDDDGVIELTSVDPEFVQAFADALAGEGVPISAEEQAEIDRFVANPAMVSDVGSGSGMRWGRWSDGHYLSSVYERRGGEEFTTTQAVLLSGSQSFHWIGGAKPTEVPTSGTARFAFVGGTPSTTQVANTVGEGITSGTIAMDFATLQTTVDLVVQHQGAITVSASGALFDDRLGFATSGSAEGGPCASGCGAFVNGVLVSGTGTGTADGVAAAYKLGTGSDHIQGVGAFALETEVTPPVEPPPDDGPTPGVVTGPLVAAEFADWLVASSGVVNAGDSADSTYSFDPEDSSYNVPGNVFDIVYFRGDAVVGGYWADQPQEGVLDIELETNDPEVANQVVADLIARDVPISEAEQAQIDLFKANPAGHADVAVADGMSWGRWTDGRYLAVDYQNVGGEEVVETAAVSLTGHQSVHWVYGHRPETVPNAGVATFGFVGGTPSTTVSGDSIGAGITSGTVSVNFGTLNTVVDMVVDHGGALNVMAEGSLFDDRLGFFNSGSAEGALCGAGCSAYVAGVLVDSGGTGVPDGVGAAYKIDTGSDWVQGVGAFARESFESAPIP